MFLAARKVGLTGKAIGIDMTKVIVTSCFSRSQH